jgi:chromosome segregation ATPase
MTHTERLTSEVNRLGAQLAAVTRQLGEADTRVVNAEIQAEELAKALRELRGDEWRCTVDWGATAERDAINARCDAALAKYDAAHDDRPGPDILPDPRIAELQR